MFNPLPSCPSRWDLGTRQLVKRMRACQVPRMPHLLRFFWKMSMPSMSGVQTRAVTRSLVLPDLGSVIFCLAMTVNRPEMAPEVAHFFSPLRM